MTYLCDQGATTDHRMMAHGKKKRRRRKNTVRINNKSRVNREGTASHPWGGKYRRFGSGGDETCLLHSWRPFVFKHSVQWSSSNSTLRLWPDAPPAVIINYSSVWGFLDLIRLSFWAQCFVVTHSGDMLVLCELLPNVLYKICGCNEISAAATAYRFGPDWGSWNDQTVWAFPFPPVILRFLLITWPLAHLQNVL